MSKTKTRNGARSLGLINGLPRAPTTEGGAAVITPKQKTKKQTEIINNNNVQL